MEDEVRQDHDQDGPAVAHEGCQADADMLVGLVEEEPVPGQEEARQDQPDQGRAGRAAQAAPFAAGRRQDEQEKTAQDRTGQDDFITRQGNMLAMMPFVPKMTAAKMNLMYAFFMSVPPLNG